MHIDLPLSEKTPPILHMPSQIMIPTRMFPIADFGKNFYV